MEVFTQTRKGVCGFFGVMSIVSFAVLRSREEPGQVAGGCKKEQRQKRTEVDET
jgi:hypothetical protein